MYTIKKQAGEFVVANKKGIIIAYFDHKWMAEEYREAQMMADEQSKILSDFNKEQLKREFLADLKAGLI